MNVPFQCFSFKYLFNIPKKKKNLRRTNGNSNLMKHKKPLTRGWEMEQRMCVGVLGKKQARDEIMVTSTQRHWRMIWDERHSMAEPCAGSLRYFEEKHQNQKGSWGIWKILLTFSSLEKQTEDHCKKEYIKLDCFSPNKIIRSPYETWKTPKQALKHLIQYSSDYIILFLM